MAEQRRYFVIVFLLALIFAAFIAPAFAEEKVRVGVLAYRGAEEAHIYIFITAEAKKR